MMNAFASFSPSRADQPAARDTLVCSRVIDETHDVKTFVFSPKGGAAPRFKPGHFLLLNLTIDGVPAVRNYSISSAPTRPHDLRITVKRVPGGLVSNWLHDNLERGREIEIEPPSGGFNFDDLPSDRPLFLSGGSGITPVMSMLRTLADSGSDKVICFILSARSPKDIIFRAELEALAGRHSNVRVHFVCAEADESWRGPTGLVDRATLLSLAPDIHARTVYVCGPEPYMKAIRAALDELGVDRARCHEESFGGLSRPAHTPLGQQAASVQFVKSAVNHQCTSAQTLLEIARSAGLFVPTACQQGICGTCRLSKLSGDVEMSDLGGLSVEEKAAGYVLACCSRPLGAVSIDL
jgi:ferredoxin-NADP reductase